MDDAPTHRSRFRIMGNHDDCLVKSVIQFLEHVKDQGGVLGIEVPCWLVGENNRRTRYYRSRQRHSLLLTTRKLERFVVQLVFES
jgi:hypothetical protein